MSQFAVRHTGWEHYKFGRWIWCTSCCECWLSSIRSRPVSWALASLTCLHVTSLVNKSSHTHMHTHTHTVHKLCSCLCAQAALLYEQIKGKCLCVCRQTKCMSCECVCVRACMPAQVYVPARPALIDLMLPEELHRATLASGWAIDLTQRASVLHPPHPNPDILHPASPLKLYITRHPLSRPRGYLPNAIKVL